MVRQKLLWLSHSAILAPEPYNITFHMFASNYVFGFDETVVKKLVFVVHVEWNKG